MSKKIILSIALSLVSFNCFALNLLVPAYFYPSANPNDSYWDEMVTALQQVAITAIINPDNGPNKDGVTNSDYERVISLFHQSSQGHIIGYVSTNYGNRPFQEIINDVETYASLYTIDGIFLDEMSNDPAKLAFYTQLTHTIRIDLNKPDWKLFGNPGTSTSIDYANLVDSVVTFENDYSQNNTPSSVVIPGKDSRLFYNVNASDVSALLIQAIKDQVGYVYITDDHGANPWDTLPSYWTQEVSALASVPEPLISLLLFTGLPYFLKRARKQR